MPSGIRSQPNARYCIRCREESQCVCHVSATEVYLIITDDLYRLQEKKEMTWGDRVRLIYGDMRKIQIPEGVDILVSELLGSFGDNEASPECLDGAMRFLKRERSFCPLCCTNGNGS
jgi:type II protein arginine methyltransferase